MVGGLLELSLQLDLFHGGITTTVGLIDRGWTLHGNAVYI